MQKKILIIVIIIALVIVAIAGAGYLIRPPQVSVSGAAISSLNLSAIGLTITLTVDNPSPVSIPLKSLDYSVLYKGKKAAVPIASGREQGIILAPGSQEIVIPVLVSNEAMIRSLLDVLTTGAIDLSISGNITPDFFGIAPAIPFSKEIITPVKTGDLLSGAGTFARDILVSRILGT